MNKIPVGTLDEMSYTREPFLHERQKQPGSQDIYRQLDEQSITIRLEYNGKTKTQINKIGNDFHPLTLEVVKNHLTDK